MMNSVGCDSALITILDKLSVAALETYQIGWDRGVILWRMWRVLEYAIYYIYREASFLRTKIAFRMIQRFLFSTVSA